MTLSTEAIRIDYEKRIEDLTETKWKIGELDSSFCENEVEALDGLITETKNFIHSQNAGNRTITDYEKGSCFESQTYLALKGKQEAYQKYYDENKKEIEAAIQQQMEISTSLESSLLKSKQTEETVNGWTSIGLSTLPIVGDVKDVQEAVMGIDLVTGEKLSWQERGISFVCMFVPVVSGKMVTKGGKKILVSVSKIPGKIKKVKNVVTKNTLKIKVSLKKVWSATKEAVKINFRKGKDCVVKLKNCSLNELQKLKESGHTFLENVKKIKNGEFYQYECVTPDGQRIPISGLDDTPKSKKVCSKGSSKSGRDSRGRMDLAGKTHPVSGVKFDSNGFPIFESKYNTKLDPQDYLKSRGTHFDRASKALYNDIMNDSNLRSQFTEAEIAIFKEGGVPKAYTWHHHQDEGVMQLVDRKIHRQTGHTGGFSIWGPGN